VQESRILHQLVEGSQIVLFFLEVFAVLQTPQDLRITQGIEAIVCPFGPSLGWRQGFDVVGQHGEHLTIGEHPARQ
jgi:hypothetical protein